MAVACDTPYGYVKPGSAPSDVPHMDGGDDAGRPLTITLAPAHADRHAAHERRGIAGGLRHRDGVPVPMASTSLGEALRTPRELSRARERAEEIGRAVIREPSGGALRVDGHMADGVDGELRLGRLADPDGGDELDRLADVAQVAAAAGLVDHPFGRGRERGGVGGEQHLAADGGGRDARGEVDRRAEEVAAALDGGPVVHADADGGRAVVAHDVADDS